MRFSVVWTLIDNGKLANQISRLVVIVAEKWTLKERFFSRKPLEAERLSLSEIQFVIDICHLVSHSNY